jgi:hypothetical protein
MDFIRRLFKKTAPERVSEDEPSTEASPAKATTQKLQGILVLSRQHMEQSAILALTQQILDEQKSLGHAVAEGFIAKHIAAGTDLDDDMYTYATILNAFSTFGGKEILNRTKEFPYQTPEGGSGKFFVLYDRR